VPLSLAEFKIPRYKYFPSHLMDRCGPKMWARLGILQACERLEIPHGMWPKFAFPQLPREYIHPYAVSDRLALPSFFPLNESESEWKARVQTIVDVFVDRELDRFRQKLQSDVKGKVLTPIKQTRDTTPIKLRYEWAAKRHCLRTPYKELASGGYTAERISKTVSAILKQAGLQGK